MRALVAVGLVTLALAACSRGPRSAAYFEAHPREAISVVGRCADGRHRGRECDNARAAVYAAERKARMDRYRQNF
jgi:hypothetical protein